MLNLFWDSLRFLVNFENSATDDERQRKFFTNFLQIACRNDSNYTPSERYRWGAIFSCRTLSLIPYGLRAILILTKCGYSVFSRHQNRRMYCIRQKTALHQTVKWTSWFLLSNVNFPQTSFCCLFKKIMNKSGPQRRGQVNRDIYHSEPHYYFVVSLIFCAFMFGTSEQHHSQVHRIRGPNALQVLHWYSEPLRSFIVNHVKEQSELQNIYIHSLFLHSHTHIHSHKINTY